MTRYHALKVARRMATGAGLQKNRYKVTARRLPQHRCALIVRRRPGLNASVRGEYLGASATTWQRALGAFGSLLLAGV